MGDDDLCSIPRIHLQERVLYPILVLRIIERVGNFADVMIECTGTDEECVRSDGFSGFCSQIGHLHRMLECAGSAFCQRVQQFGVDIRQFDQGNGRNKPEHFLKGIYQSIATDGKQEADEEIEVHPEVDRREDTCLRKGDGGISDRLREEYPCRRLYQLGAARHVAKRGDSNHSDYDLNEEELNGCGYYNGSDEDGCEMQEECGSGIEEHAR